MNCKCGNRALFFEKFTEDGIFNTFKCDTQESKKKGKCDFFHVEKIKDIKDINIASVQNNKTTEEQNPPQLTAIKMYTKDLFQYIKLYKNVTHLPETYSTAYTANINHILKRLNMPLYFANTESIDSLENRINMNVCVKRVERTNIYPITLTEYHLEIAVPMNIIKNKKRKIKISAKLSKLPDFKSFIEQEEKTKNTIITDNNSVCSDNESVLSEDDNDNTFDVDNCDSDQDVDDDIEAFSD